MIIDSILIVNKKQNIENSSTIRVIILIKKFNNNIIIV